LRRLVIDFDWEHREPSQRSGTLGWSDAASPLSHQQYVGYFQGPEHWRQRSLGRDIVKQAHACVILGRQDP
jgi:hypothetical protein